MDDEFRDLVDTVGGRLDFGEYELDAYLSVLESGELTPSEVTDRSGVPQTRVYDVLRDLEDRGLVEIEEGRPMTVLAVDPSESFDGIESTVGELVEEFSERYVAPGWDAEAASLVRTRRSIIRHLEGVIGSAEYELAVALTPDLLERFEDGLRERREDGCHVSLLLFPSSEAPSPETYDYGSVSTVARARRGVTSPVMAVADGAHSVYATREALSDSDRYGVIFQQSILGFLVYGFYTTMLATTAELVYDGSDDRPWPRRYASIRQCIRDVREGYRITVEGRDVETGDLRRVEGTVADTRMDASGGVATLTVATADGEVTVGGRMAALEDVEAHTVVADR